MMLQKAEAKAAKKKKSKSSRRESFVVVAFDAAALTKSSSKKSELDSDSPFHFVFRCIMQPPLSSLLPPKKRQQAAQQHRDIAPLQASVQKEAEPEPSEGDIGVSTSTSGQPSINPSIASVVVVEVETSKIRGSAPPRKPRVGQQYQAELPDLLEQPIRLQKR